MSQRLVAIDGRKSSRSSLFLALAFFSLSPPGSGNAAKGMVSSPGIAHATSTIHQCWCSARQGKADYICIAVVVLFVKPLTEKPHPRARCRRSHGNGRILLRGEIAAAPPPPQRLHPPGICNPLRNTTHTHTFLSLFLSRPVGWVNVRSGFMPRASTGVGEICRRAQPQGSCSNYTRVHTHTRERVEALNDL